jgi:hypothetical protein
VPEVFAGLRDTVGILRDLAGENHALTRLDADLENPPSGLRAAFASLDQAKGLATAVAASLEAVRILPGSGGRRAVAAGFSSGADSAAPSTPQGNGFSGQLLAFVHGIAPWVVTGVSAVSGVFVLAAGRSCHQANPIMALRTE